MFKISLRNFSENWAIRLIWSTLVVANSSSVSMADMYANKFSPYLSVQAQNLREKFELRTVTTLTPWSSTSKITYRGVSLRQFLKDQGIEHTAAIDFEAANGYVSVVPMNEIQERDPILAIDIKCDGEIAINSDCKNGQFVPLSIENYGPVFVVWPSYGKGTGDYINDSTRWVWFVTRVRHAI